MDSNRDFDHEKNLEGGDNLSRQLNEKSKKNKEILDTSYSLNNRFFEFMDSVFVRERSLSQESQEL